MEIYNEINIVFIPANPTWDFPGGSAVKNLPAMQEVGSIPGSGISPGGRNGNLFQYSCWENPMDRGAWRATFHGVMRNMVEEIQHSHMQKTKILHAAQLGQKNKSKEPRQKFLLGKERKSVCSKVHSLFVCPIWS